MDMYGSVRIFFVSVVSVVSVVLGICSSLVHAQSDTLPVSSRDQVFTHSTLGFQILVPANASLTEGDVPMVASIRSRTGWGVNIQMAPHKAESGVEEMIARLEARYLGNSKPWDEKLMGRHLVAFEKQGYEGIYTGSGMKVRLMLLRTSGYDYVMFFIAPAESFETSSSVFDRILESFRPSRQSAGGVVAEQAPPDPDNAGTMVTFRDGKLGYSMMYPRQWRVSRPNSSTAVFAGEAGTESAFTTISVQNVAPPIPGSDRMLVEKVLQELQAQMAYNVSDIRHVHGKPFTLGTTDNPVEASQFLSDYRIGETAFRQWTLALPRPEAGVVHVWAYTAPLDRFTKYQSIAEKMAGSWMIEPVTR